MRKTAKFEKSKTSKIRASKARALKAGALKVSAQTTRLKGTRQSPETKLAELKRRLLEIYDLNAAGSVLSWDEATYMPAGGATARGRQTATLRRLRMSSSSIRRLVGLSKGLLRTPRACRRTPTTPA